MPRPRIHPHRIVLGLAFGALSLVGSTCLAQSDKEMTKLLAGRDGNRWVVPIFLDGDTRVPRVCASLRAAYFEGFPDQTVVFHPEIEYWEIRFKGDAAAPNVVLEFDSYPATLEEAKRTTQAGDGTLTLRCSQGRTQGDKLRFEPQPHKNTIGYWAVAGDSVSWPVTIAKPGTFNVGLLQGAGARGGGTAKVSLLADEKVVDSLQFQVEVTGHFQNFFWKHAGSLEVTEPGDYSLRIEASNIKDVAHMDVRQVHLSPQPATLKK